MIRLWLFFILIFSVLNARAQGVNPALQAINVIVDPDKTHQTIESFGASDAWSGQFVGLWPDAKKKAIAALLFSRKSDKAGQPKGIGLSLWRFNFGAGSSQQGDKSGIKDEWRRNESFLDEDGNLDLNRQKGQLWFLKEAEKNGVKQFLGFFNSPPVRFTKNGLAYSSDGKSNLSPEMTGPFCNYITDAIIGVKKKTGILFNYISPVNEPQWDWKDGKQEGNPYTNEEVSGLVKSLNKNLVQKKLPTRIVLPEAGKLDYLIATKDKPGRGEQITAFFSEPSTSVANLSQVDNVIAGHSYFTTSPYQSAVQLRRQVKEKVSQVKDLRFWMSEYCILGDNAGEIKGGGRDLGITSALYIAKVIHNDLVNAGATAWHWWLAVSPYNYKDGLIYIDKDKTDGNYYPSKMLWALGNFSRFIRPGFIRVDTGAGTSEDSDLLISAYTGAKSNKLVCVIINDTDSSKRINLILKNGRLRNLKQYVTSHDGDLKPMDLSKDDSLIIPPWAVVSVQGQMVKN